RITVHIRGGGRQLVVRCERAPVSERGEACIALHGIGSEIPEAAIVHVDAFTTANGVSGCGGLLAGGGIAARSLAAGVRIAELRIGIRYIGSATRIEQAGV